MEGNLTAALGAIANTKSEHEWTIVLDGVVDDKRYSVSRELQEILSQAISRRATRRCCYNPIDGTIAVLKKAKFPAAWRDVMEACIAKDTWVDVYKHDLEVPGFDFIAPAMTVKHHWNTRGYRFEFNTDDISEVAKRVAEYVLSKEKVHEEAREVQFIVRGAGITLEKLQDAMAAAIGNDKYWNHYACFFSFKPNVLERDKKGNATETEPDAAVITLRARRFALGRMASLLDTIAIDAFDAKDGEFCGYGFYEIEHAKLRKVSRLILPKGNELTEEEWQEFTNHLRFYFFNEKFKDLVFESDKEGCEKLKACAVNNRKKDPYPWRGANAWTFESADKENELRIVAWPEVYNKQKDEFLKNVGISNNTTKIEPYTWLNKDKLAEIVLQMSKPESKGHLHVEFDTGGALKSAIRKLLKDETIADKRGDWILETSEDIDLESLLPYMKTYFAMPYYIGSKREILFVTDENKCREYASEILKGVLKNSKNKDVFEIEPYWLRFCMKEVLEAAAAADSKVKTLKVNIDENNADALKNTLLDFCKTVPVERKPFTLRLVAPSHTGGKLLEKLIEPFKNWQKSFSNKSIILADDIEQLNDKGEHVYILGHYEVSLNFMRLEDFFITHYINGHSYKGSMEIGEEYKDLPTATLFNCMSDPKCEAVHFEILRDITKEEVIKGITSMLANQKDGRAGWMVHFASEKIADEETVKEIADAVSKLNKDENNRFVVPMYKDNLFLFVDKDGWTRKEQMAKNDAFEYKGELKGNKLQELLFLMSLPTSKAKTLALKDYDLNERSLKLILDHGNRTGWSLTGCYMCSSVKGKSMCCLSINDKPYAQHFLDEKTFKKEILKVFGTEMAKSLAKDTCDLRNIFDYKASYWAETYGRGFVSLADALKLAEQLNGGYRTLKLKKDFDYMNRCENEKAAEFITWIKEGLKAICNVENPGKRYWCLSLKNLSKEQRKQITKLKLDKNTKRELVFSDGDEGELNIGTRKPFAQRLTKDGVLVLKNSDLFVSNFDEIFKSANELPGLKEVACPEDGYISDVAEGVKKVLKFGLNKTWERITFSSEWDIKEIAEEINEKIQDDDLPYKVEGKTNEEGAGVLILKDLRLPALTTKDDKLTFRSEKGSEENKQVKRLAIGDALKTWFGNNKGNRHAWKDFTEALAEQPQIQYVDLSRLKDDKDVHKLYENIKDWEKLLNIPGTMFNFVVTQEKKGFKDDDNKNVACYHNLKDRKDIAWHLKKNGDVWSSNGEEGLKGMKIFSMKPTKDKIAVTEKGRRLLWNRTALNCLFNQKGSLEKMVKDKSKDIKIEIVDFTIGEPKTAWTTSDGKQHTWEDVWKYAGSKDFINNVKKFKTVRVYEECLGNDNLAYLKKNQTFKYIGNRNGKRVLEISFDTSDDDDSGTSTAFESENEGYEAPDYEESEKHKKHGKKKGIRKAPKKKAHYEEEEEEEEGKENRRRE